MRKAQWEEILDFIKSLYQAHNEIKNAFGQGSTVIVQNMLSECQEFARLLGEAIERTEGEGHVTVKCVEDYCEELFHIYEKIGDGQIHENKIGKSLRKALLKIENSVKNDISIKKEVVFFPYKASMWDSLESIYFAAKEDSDCEAYCVPIPYFDLKPDHSFGQMHYEGGEYPENVEVIDWEAYRFEERRPDEIYIHNGYDNWNLVTSVHPRFYSENLKQYTDKLVYVPYFIMGDIDPEDEKTIEAKKHFCFIPGIINADKVIVESKSVRRLYINEYLKAAKENGLSGQHVDRKYLEKKFLGVGSPKFDKVAEMDREKLKIPKEWEKYIRKADGQYKKIVMYNNSITSLLKNEENMLKKIEEVLNVFKAFQDEIVLWWRPHPLIQSTIQAMRPELWRQYQKIVNEYVDGKWGIYDDTADIGGAVSFTDAYYGDWSSVVYLYERTGKPIMILDC